MDQPASPKPRPVPTPTSAPFWDALRDERIRIERCDACGQWVHYPRRRCPQCLSDRLSWQDVPGSGTVYTFTVARQPSTPLFADEVPQIIAVVGLDGGPRVTTTLVGVDPDDVVVGMPVAPVYDHGEDGVTLLRFRPSGGDRQH
jgi:uncharacterized OB-fold protein